MKSGRKDKGDVLMDIATYNPDLKEITIYDDFAGKMEDKITELTKIKDQLSKDITYNIFYVENGSAQLMESTNILMKMIHEELINFK